MLNAYFTKILIKETFENNIPKVTMKKGIDLYLNSKIEMMETSSTSIMFTINDKNIIIKSDVGISYIINNEKVKKDEYILACLLSFKRKYIADNEIMFDKKDFLIENNYYNNTYITFYNYDEYELRINFIIGLIDYLYELGMYQECLQYVVDFYLILFDNLTFDNKYKEYQYIYKYQVIKNKQEMIINNYEKVIELFRERINAIAPLSDFIYTIVVNYPKVLSNFNMVSLYSYLINNYNDFERHTQRYKDICIHKMISEWYLGSISENEMIKNIDKQEVRYCYIKYLSENYRYQDICKALDNTKFNITNQEINYLCVDAYYKCNDLKGAVNIFNRYNSISYERYLLYKDKFPLLFDGEYLDSIITFMIDNYNNDELIKILADEKLKKYEIFKIARENFELLDSKFDEYLGVNYDLLIKIYQKEIINVCDQLIGRYNYIPEVLMKKFEKIRKIKNGKYYLAESIRYIQDNYVIAYDDDLIEYFSKLEV